MSNGFNVHQHCQHATRPAKKTVLTSTPPHTHTHTMLSACLPSENINVRGGLWFAHFEVVLALTLKGYYGVKAAVNPSI